MANRQSLGTFREELYSHSRMAAWSLLPVVVLVLGLSLRLYGLDWDQGQLFHPDERALLMKVEEIRFPLLSEFSTIINPQESPLNPRWFPYGTLPLYLVEVLTTLSSPLVDWNVFQLRFIGRLLSALADIGTMVFVYRLGTHFYGRRVGLLAAGLGSIAVIHIQLSHFYTVDTFLAFFTIGTIYFAARATEEVGLRHFIAAAVFLGLAIACKVSILPLILVLGISRLLHDSNLRNPHGQKRDYLYRVVEITKYFVGGLLIAFLAFFVTNPYAVLDWPTYLSDISFQGEMVRRAVDLPYTRQYIDTTLFWYHIHQLAIWGLGLPLGILAWIAIPVTTVVAILKKRPIDLIIIAAIVPYFLVFGSLEVKFLRYMLPIVPLMLILVSRLFFATHDFLRLHGTRWKTPVDVIMASVVILTALYTLSFLGIYTNQHPSNAMTDWIQEHIPANSVILQEHWDEPLRELHGYDVRELPLYDADNAEKARFLASQLTESNYIVLYSHRLYGTIGRLAERYTLTHRYYELLFSGELGFELGHHTKNYPSFGPIILVDDTFTRSGLPTPLALQSFQHKPGVFNLGFADESFTVYDHPKVMLFQKVQNLSEAQYLQKLRGPPYRSPPKLGLMMDPVLTQMQQAGGTWSDLFGRNNLVNKLPLVFWLLFIQIVSLITLPIALMLFRSLPDRGVVLAKGFGLLLVAFISWIFASLHWLASGWPSVLCALILISITSVGILSLRMSEIRSILKDKKRIIFLGECLFIVAFVTFFVLRLANPDLWHPFRGGEKPMDFAYLNAVVKSTFMPPYDPWFSGGYLNYYYFGHFIVATITKTIGIRPEAAFNLAVPLFFALTITTSFSLVYNLAASIRQQRSYFAWHPVIAGGLGSLFVGVIGNLDGAIQLVQNSWATLTTNSIFPAFDFWRPSRMMAELPGNPQVGHEITEFPFFTFLFADLHAHLMAIPFNLLSLSLGLALVLSAIQRRSSRALAPIVISLAFVIGSLQALNAWDYPIFLVLGLGAVGIATYTQARKLTWRSFAETAAWGSLLIILSYVFFLPYHNNFDSAYTSLTRSEWQTDLWQYGAIHGLFIFIIGSYLVIQINNWIRSHSNGKTLNAPWQKWRPTADRIVIAIGGISISILLSVGIMAVLKGYTTLIFLLGAILIVTTIIVKHLPHTQNKSPQTLFVMMVLGAALALGALVELVTLEGDIDRMNTVFKFYGQAWLLMAIASAYMLASMGIQIRSFQKRGWPRMGRIAWVSALALLVASASIYPILGTTERLHDRFQTLPLTIDGTAFMEKAIYHDKLGTINLQWDLEAIQWLQDEVKGSPVIIEGRTPLYRWGSRISSYTGLPSVLGWGWHQQQQRRQYQQAIMNRAIDVETFYTTTNPTVAMDILQRYDVKYVIVGELERLYYPADGIAKFSIMSMPRQDLLLVYENLGTRIYQVLAL